MTATEKVALARLDEFIQLAKKGKTVEAEVAPRKTPIVQKVHPGETDDALDEIDGYLLAVDFTCAPRAKPVTS